MSDTNVGRVSNEPDLSDDDVLRYTQRVRHEYVKEAMSGATLFPDDKGDRALLLQVLSDMDRTAIAKKKMVIEQGQNENDRAAAAIIAQIARDPNMAGIMQSAAGQARDITPRVEMLPEIEKVPGHQHIGVEIIMYDDFVGTIPGHKGNKVVSDDSSAETDLI